MIQSFLWQILGPRLPRTELLRFKKINFFPPIPDDLEKTPALCLGSKSRTIGDALALSTLPKKLKTRFPNLKITTYPRGFNPVVFAGNPYISSVQWLPDALYGDDCNWGSGQLIQLKEEFFGLPISDHPRPEIYLKASEEKWINQLLMQEPSSLPLCLIHPWGHTHSEVLSSQTWQMMIQENKAHFRFWQLGLEGQAPIQGCERHFLLPRNFHHARKLFALLSRADFFIGVDSGPMHVARAFNVPSLILSSYDRSVSEIFQIRRTSPYYLNCQSRHAFLYEENSHLNVKTSTAAALMRGMSDFLLQNRQRNR